MTARLEAEDTMLRSANDLRKTELQATDGRLGHIADVLFDDQAWGVRYLVVDTGGWLSGRLVLISPEAITDATERSVAVALTRRQVEESPSIETDKPVSMQQEAAYRTYFNWPPYGGFVWGEPSLGMAPAALDIAEDERRRQAREAAKGDHHLRSAHALEKYHIRARDGDVGHVDDLLIDADAWTVRYVVVATRDWLPGKHVLLSPEWVESIDWRGSEFVMGLAREQLKSAPEYDRGAGVTREYEAALHAHYQRAGYWTGRQEETMDDGIRLQPDDRADREGR